MWYAYLDLHEAFVIAIPEERMRVLCMIAVIRDLNAGPAQLLDGDERLGDVLILRHEERAEMQGEFLGVEGVGRDLGEVCEEDQIAVSPDALGRTVRDVLDWKLTRSSVSRACREIGRLTGVGRDNDRVVGLRVASIHSVFCA